MTHLWRGLSVMLGVLIIFSLFYLYVQYEQTEQRSTTWPDTVENGPAVMDSSIRNEVPKPAAESESASSGKREAGNKKSADKGIENSATQPSNSSDFVVFDGTNFRPTPSVFAEVGMEPIDIVYSTRMFDDRNNHELAVVNSMVLPEKGTVIKEARKAAQVNDIAVIDIEHWPLDSKKNSTEVIERSLDNYLTVLDWFQKAAPHVAFGYYGEVPIRSYWDAIRPRSSKRYQRWMSANNRLQSLAEKVDVLFPSLYTFYTDRDRWVDYAIGMISEAKRYNPEKPVYVFLWPEYHPYNASVRGKKIEGDFWKLQLETTRKHADGIVIWAGGNFDWNPNDAWWQVTKEFMEELKLNS